MKVSTNGRYIVDDEGDPFFYLADTAWALLYRPTREEVDLYLRNRRDKGFTVVMPVVLWGEDMTARNVYGEAPLVDWDPTRHDETERASSHVRLRRARGLGGEQGGSTGVARRTVADLGRVRGTALDGRSAAPEL